jgi:ABC-type phosphate transport system substrate-binding protein
MNIKKATALGAIAAVTVGVIAFGGSAAQADVNNGNPSYQTVGSDTTQDLLAGLATQIHTGGPSSALAISTWDATPQPTTFTSINTGTTVPRPDGSGQGVDALRAAELGNVYARTTGGVTQTSSAALSTNDVKFARSSSGPSSTSPTGTYTWVPFAVDGVSYAVNGGVSTITNLTKADLKAIYSAADGATVSLSIGSKKIGKQTTAGVDIVPFLPQAGSGTRKFWTDTYLAPLTLGTAVSDTYTDGSGTHDVQEHNGSVLGAVTNGIVPFSVSQWAGQSRAADLSNAITGYGVPVTDRRGTAVLGDIDSTSPLVLTPGGRYLLDTSFAVLRPVYNVVKYDRVTSGTGSYDSVLSGILTGTSAQVGTQPGLILGTTVVADFGFGDLSTNPSSPTVINGTGYVLGQTTIRGN